MKTAPVLMVFGQSNAHASGVALREDERITRPMKHVFALGQEENQAWSPAPVVWRGYTSDGTNLGETQDHTACYPTEYARIWETEAGARGLPDLYIIRISVGAQGVTEGYMWHPDYPRRLIPGPHGKADIALFPLSCEVIARVFADLRERGLEPAVLGLHWFGTEEETGIPVEKLDVLPELHRNLIRGWREAAGCRVPVILYKIRSVERSASIGEDPRCIEAINASFEETARTTEDVTVADPRDCPDYDPSIPFTNGIYSDGNHLGANTHRWLARRDFEQNLRQN